MWVNTQVVTKCIASRQSHAALLNGGIERIPLIALVFYRVGWLRRSRKGREANSRHEKGGLITKRAPWESQIGRCCSTTDPLFTVWGSNLRWRLILPKHSFCSIQSQDRILRDVLPIPALTTCPLVWGVDWPGVVPPSAVLRDDVLSVSAKLCRCAGRAATT